MSDATAEYFAAQESFDKLQKMKGAAAQIRNDWHLKTVLLAFPVQQRREMYERLKPHLMFRPLGYKSLMRLHPLKEGLPH